MAAYVVIALKKEDKRNVLRPMAYAHIVAENQKQAKDKALEIWQAFDPRVEQEIEDYVVAELDKDTTTLLNNGARTPAEIRRRSLQ